MEALASQPSNVRENLTYLGYAWLKALSEICYFDARNEASKRLADDIIGQVRQEPKLHQLSYDGTTEIELNCRDDEQAAWMLRCYLCADSGNRYQSFLDYAIYSHRTLQQNLTRFFLEWFVRAAKLDRSSFLENAGVYLRGCVLPFI
ncbi:MAG TPA: hypothetical protein IAA21_01735 [Candidatus Blautia faecigallinarum]|uniref:Uncharacterized protein n=1 Tax=Candidatus Blautia faecigallinarum TaxID=2838488 RepID=A0A9D2DQZ0_9FIRM|nr:hypothetical protein [Candidatus Blautia faecigallinarum]